MLVTFNQFKSAVAQAHSAHVKHDNLELSLFDKTRAQIVEYASITPNWRLHVTKKQAEETIPYCIELAKNNA